MDDLQEELPEVSRIAFASTGRNRDPWLAALALDGRIGRMVLGASEPMLGQVRLAWWRDQLGKPIGDRPRGDPLLDPQIARLEAVAVKYGEARGAAPACPAPLYVHAGLQGNQRQRVQRHIDIAERLGVEIDAHDAAVPDRAFGLRPLHAHGIER